jgi:hypothetical protein
VAAAALVVGGGVILGVGAFRHVSPPQAPLAKAGQNVAAPKSTAGKALLLPGSLPVRLDIPRIGVHTRLLSLGLDGQGAAAVPELSQAQLASWYNGGPSPGEVGPAVLLGHVDTKSGPAVFYRLGEMRAGDEVDVTRKDGTVAVFAADSVARYPKSGFPAEKVFGDLGYAGLRLITCGGDFDSSTGHYLDNTIVFGHLTGSRAT